MHIYFKQMLCGLLFSNVTRTLGTVPWSLLFEYGRERIQADVGEDSAIFHLTLVNFSENIVYYLLAVDKSDFGLFLSSAMWVAHYFLDHYKDLVRGVRYVHIQIHICTDLQPSVL